MNDTKSPKPKRRWFQFSRWTLLLFVLAVLAVLFRPNAVQKALGRSDFRRRAVGG